MWEHHAARRVPPLGSSCLAALAILSLGQASAWMTPSLVSRQARPTPLPAAAAACRSAGRCTVAALRMGVEGSEAPRKGQTGGKSVVLRYFNKRHPLSLGHGQFDPNNQVGTKAEDDGVVEAEARRHRWLLSEIASKVAEIQQPGLSDYKILELDGLIIELVCERVRVERRIIELGGPAAVSNSIVHLYKPVGTEDEEPLQQRLATAGVPLAHARICFKSAETACMCLPALLPSCGVSVVCQLHAAG
jgi:hypothetical protein